jgi:hypothetical protein
MGGLWMGIVAVAAVVGYLVWRSRSKDLIPPRKHDFKIKVEKPGNYKSTTDPKDKKVRSDDTLEWRVKEPGHRLPEGAHVFLRFPEGSPVRPLEPSDGGTRTIAAVVIRGLPVGKEYKYKIFYRLGKEEVELEDPKLIIES